MIYVPTKSWLVNWSQPLFLCARSPAGIRPDPGDRGGDDGDGGGHHLPAEPLPPICPLPPLPTRPRAQETPAAGQRKSGAVFTPDTCICFTVAWPDLSFPSFHANNPTF